MDSIYDDRFDILKVLYPSWSSLEGGKGAKRGANGKFYLPPGSKPTAKMGVMGDDKDPNNPALEPTGLKAKKEPGKLAKVEEPTKKVKAEVVKDEEGMMNITESLDYANQKLKDLRERMQTSDRELMRTLGQYVGSTNAALNNLAMEASDGKVGFNPSIDIPAPPKSPKGKTLEEEVGGMNLSESLKYSNRKLKELEKRMENTDRQTFRAIGEYVDATNQTITNIAKEAGVSTGLGGSTAKSRKGMGGSKKPKQLKGS
jgi:hypothetical protein